MSSQQDSDRDQERHDQQTTPDNIFTNIYNVISGARQSASQEFTRFWEGLGHTHSPASSSTSVGSRKIATPTLLRNRQYNRSNSINGRFLPDDNVRGTVKDVEIQTDDYLKQPPLSAPPAVPQKRSYSVVEEYHIPFPVKKPFQRSLEPLERPGSLSRRIETKDDDFPGQQRQPKTSSTQEKPTVNNSSKSVAVTPPAPPPPPPLKIQTSIRTAADSLSPSRKRPAASASKASDRLTPSPNRDIVTGSKSVRRLTLELEEQFSPRFPSPLSPKKQQQQQRQQRQQDSPLIHPDTSAIPPYEQKTPPSSTSSTAAAAAAASPSTLKTFNFNAPLPPLPTESDLTAPENPPIAAAAKDDGDRYANLLKQKELDERVNKLEEKVSIARTRVTEYSSEGITSPTPSHRLTESEAAPSKSDRSSLTPRDDTADSAVDKPVLSSSPLRSTMVVANQDGSLPFSYTPAAARGASYPYRFSSNSPPTRNTIPSASTSPINKKSATSPSYRRSRTIHPPLKKDQSCSPSSVSYAAAKAAIQEAVDKKGFASSSVSSLSAAKTSVYSVPKNTPSPYLQRTPLKPNDTHKSKMKELIQMIPTVRLRKTDTLIGPDGVKRPNPFWNEIYNHGRRF
ncbi:hypothetical protein [Parasitella parasitica]|uniref:Uncharacterized protein n=1 Tax=Parasitella parasitica TaxID=35722 RepID=A0A0B7NI86_9FUNG|nr:hypothetical protein [Parasitella parasitica]